MTVFGFEIDWWVVLGLAAQLLFSARFIVQWLVSEKKKESTIPEAFWYLSLLGGVLLFIYAVQRRDIVFTLGQGFGVFIYIRNIVFIRRKKKEKPMI